MAGDAECPAGALVPDCAPETGAPPAGVLEVVAVGDGELVAVELVDGDGDGDGDVVVGVPLGDELGDVDGDELLDGLPDAEPALQLGDTFGEPLPE